jgi:hypothetical protein
MRRHWIATALLGLSLAGCAGGFSDPGPLSRHDLGVQPRVVRGAQPLQCVAYARSQSGIAIWGDAGTWWDRAAGRYQRSRAPERGAVMVLRGGSAGHVAVVRRVVDDRQIVVDHANWLNRGEISLDSPVMDVSEDNDWSRVRVWYTPGRHYGGRVYPVQGFILPAEPGQNVASR